MQAELGIKSQRHFYRICQLFPCGRLLERSRFNRRARQLIGLVQLIRQAMNTQISPDTIVIIDSFPLPLCQPVRNYRTRIFDGLADIGYNASKNLWVQSSYAGHPIRLYSELRCDTSICSRY